MTAVLSVLQYSAIPSFFLNVIVQHVNLVTQLLSARRPSHNHLRLPSSVKYLVVVSLFHFIDLRFKLLQNTCIKNIVYVLFNHRRGDNPSLPSTF